MSVITVPITYSTTLEEIVDHIHAFLSTINASLGEVKCLRVEQKVILSVTGKGTMYFLMEKIKTTP